MAGSSRDGVIDRFRRPNESHDHHKYTGMQMDIEPDKVRKESIKKKQAADDSMYGLSKQCTIFANNILPPEEQQSVPGRDTGES